MKLEGRREKGCFLKWLKMILYGTKWLHAVFVFITLAVLLGASATNNIANLIQSMSALQETAEPADITQMHRRRI